MKNKHYSFQISMKVEFSQLIFKKYSNNKFCKNLSSGSQVAPGGGWKEKQT
jgi:hypothetical protein